MPDINRDRSGSVAFGKRSDTGRNNTPNGDRKTNLGQYAFP